MEKKNTAMKINEIKTRKYEGYVWFSNKETPKVLRNEEYDFSKHTENENPFIVEALLYCREENISVMIRHTDKYHIKEFDLNEYSDENFVDVQYLPHRLDGVNKVNFKQLWLPEEDEHCEKLEVLKMKALIFTGFNN